MYRLNMRCKLGRYNPACSRNHFLAVYRVSKPQKSLKYVGIQSGYSQYSPTKTLVFDESSSMAFGVSLLFCYRFLGKRQR